MDVAFYSRSELTAAQREQHDRVYGALTQSVRELAEAQLRTTVPLAEAESVTSVVRDAVARLLAQARPGPLGVQVDEDGRVRNHGNTVVGLRNPFAMATREHRIQWNDNGATAEFDLGPLCEGPPGCVHGGVLALVLDQLLGEAAASAGGPGMTGRLTLTYRRPTPLGTVSATAWLERTEGIKTWMRAELKDAEGNITVEAEGLFILPRWAREVADGWPRRPSTFE